MLESRPASCGCPIPLYYEEHEQPYDFFRYTQFGLRTVARSGLISSQRRVESLNDAYVQHGGLPTRTGEVGLCRGDRGITGVESPELPPPPPPCLFARPICRVLSRQFYLLENQSKVHGRRALQELYDGPPAAEDKRLNVVIDNSGYLIRNDGVVAMLAEAARQFRAGLAGCRLSVLTTAPNLLSRYIAVDRRAGRAVVSGAMWQALGGPILPPGRRRSRLTQMAVRAESAWRRRLSNPAASLTRTIRRAARRGGGGRESYPGSTQPGRSGGSDRRGLTDRLVPRTRLRRVRHASAGLPPSAADGRVSPRTWADH